MTELTSHMPPASRRAIKVNTTRGEAEFDRARRRTRLVNRLKFILPATALVGIGGFVAAYMTVARNLPFTMSGLNLDTKSLTIEKPRFSGFRGTSQSYDLSAARAIQDLANPKVVRIEEVAGTFGIEAGATATLTATAGVYDSSAGTLRLTDGISVKTTTGIAVSLVEAALDFSKQTLVSGSPVVIASTEGEIRAGTVRISDGGRKIAFENGVSVTYIPKAGDGIATAPAQEDQ